MENPATWGAAERVVAAAMRRADEGRQQGRVGLSTARQITDALREAGLLVESGLLDDEHELVSGSPSLKQPRPDFDAPPLGTAVTVPAQPWCVLERDDELYTLYGPYGSEDAARLDAEHMADDFETETLVLPMNPPTLTQPVDARLEV